MASSPADNQSYLELDVPSPQGGSSLESSAEKLEFASLACFAAHKSSFPDFERCFARRVRVVEKMGLIDPFLSHLLFDCERANSSEACNNFVNKKAIDLRDKVLKEFDS